MKKTTLYEEHVKLGGRIIDFNGWELPVQYSSIIDEHLAVRQAAGIFDVSHMGEIEVTGIGSLDFLQFLTCNDLSKINKGQVQYNLVVNEQGGVVDDVLIYFIDKEHYFIVCNASNVQKLFEYLSSLKSKYKYEGKITNKSQEWDQLAIQGPLASQFVEEILSTKLDHIPYYHFQDLNYQNETIRVSRTGYTGAGGLEVYLSPRIVKKFFNSILDLKLNGIKLQPAGLGSRDSLRLEVLFPLYGNELNEEWTPVESGVGWTVKEKEKPFLASEKILAYKKGTLPGQVLGFQMKDKLLARKHYNVWDNEGKNRISEVLSAAYSPILKVGIGTLYLKEGYPIDKGVLIEVRDKKIEASLHKKSFLKDKT